MGPTNIALVKLYDADNELRQAQERLDSATKNVRIQERRVKDLQERLALGQSQLREQQSKTASLELDLKSRDGRIERFRSQQQNAKTSREYQAFLVEINTEKVDKGKVEEELLRSMEQVEIQQKGVQELTAQFTAEQSKLQTMTHEIGDRVQQLQADIDALVPKRQAAADAVEPRAREAFERLAERFDGEALAAIAKPNPRREEYICDACNMSLVVDIYNRLHTRDELVFCPSCRRILYIPADLPIEAAVHLKNSKEPRTPKEPKEPKSPRTPRARKPKGGEIGAATGRQTSAADVLRSMQPEEEPASDSSPSQSPSPQESQSSQG